MSRPRLEDFAVRPVEPQARPCEHPGCVEPGAFRAPRTRELTSYYWFCLEHVRAYNSAWNYYAGMKETEIEAEIRSDTTWQRPTWPLGSRVSPTYAQRLNDMFGLFAESGGPGGGAHRPAQRRREPTAQELALLVFDIEPPFTMVRLKARYKELVKLHHPDAHGGDREAEEKLKVINQAYATLKACYFS